MLEIIFLFKKCKQIAGIFKQLNTFIIENEEKI